MCVHVCACVCMCVHACMCARAHVYLRRHVLGCAHEGTSGRLLHLDVVNAHLMAMKSLHGLPCRRQSETLRHTEVGEQDVSVEAEEHLHGYVYVGMRPSRPRSTCMGMYM